MSPPDQCAGYRRPMERIPTVGAGTLFGPVPKISGKRWASPAIAFHHPVRLSSTRDYNGLINAPLKDVGDVRGSGALLAKSGFSVRP